MRSGDSETQWARLFPAMTVRLGGIEAEPGEIEPSNGPAQGWMRRIYRVPAGALDMAGEISEFRLTFRALQLARDWLLSRYSILG